MSFITTQLNCFRALDQACVKRALAGARHVRPALLMLGGLVVLNARWQKTFLFNLHRFIDTQGRGVHGPDERGLERLFTHNVKLYNCAMACVRIPNFNTKPKTPRPAWQRHVRNGTLGWLT